MLRDCTAGARDRRTAVRVAPETDATAERRTSRELQQYREHLEDLVAARTAELERANEAVRQNEERLNHALDASND